MPIGDLIQKGKKIYRNEFDQEPTIVVSAPGRVNLIGEHVDYCDGFVLPMVSYLYLINCKSLCVAVTSCSKSKTASRDGGISKL